MKTLIFIIGIVGLFTIVSSCKKDDDLDAKLYGELEAILEEVSPTGSLNHFIMPDEDDLENIPQDPKNQLTAEKVELGKMLFHETGLALAPINPNGKGTYSCASCHHAGAGFQAARHQAIGEGGNGFGFNGEGRVPMFSIYTGEELDVQPLRSPTAMNGAYQDLMLWNGQFGSTGLNEGTEQNWTPDTPKAINHLGYEGLETQAIAGLEVHRMEVNKPILDTLGYKERFDVVFWNIPENERYTKLTAGLAIAAFERTLLANQSPFQMLLKENQMALSKEELRGALIFFDPAKGNCVSCHTGPALNSMSFHALGMKDLYQIPEEAFQTSEFGAEVFGRGGFTGNSEDMYKFKTPQLYNLVDSPFYGHGSSIRTIREIVNYKNEAIPQKSAVPRSQLAEEFVPLGLSDEEIDNLTAFLETGLHDPNLSRYVPPELPSGNCFPNNDDLSQLHLGCN